MNTLLEDVKDSLEQVSQSITGINQVDWETNHLFYNESATIGTGAMNRGRCPFVRYYRGEKNYELQSIQEAGGSVDSVINVEIVVNKVKQEPAWDLAFSIFESFMKDLKNKDNYLDSGFTTQRLEINPMLFMLRVTIQVRNSYGG